MTERERHRVILAAAGGRPVATVGREEAAGARRHVAAPEERHG